jgi:predicted nucleic acid-binding protein
VKLYADEHGHRAIRALDMLVVSAIARAEVPSALWRKTRTGELEDTAVGILLSALELDFHGGPDMDSRFTIVSVTEHVLIAAAKEAARHALRAYDAVQLASALAVRQMVERIAAAAGRSAWCSNRSPTQGDQQILTTCR